MDLKDKIKKGIETASKHFGDTSLESQIEYVDGINSVFGGSPLSQSLGNSLRELRDIKKNSVPKYGQVLARVRRVNKQLLNEGYSIESIDAFWDDCIKEAKKHPLDSGRFKRELLLDFMTWYAGDENSKLPEGAEEIVNIYLGGKTTKRPVCEHEKDESDCGKYWVCASCGERVSI